MLFRSFSGEYGEHTSAFSEDDIRFSWYALAGRADTVSLFFARPKVFQANDKGAAKFNGSVLGEDNGTWRDKGVAEVNKFHNYFAGTSENASSMSNNKVFAVERGTKGSYEGILLVNLDRGAKDINESCSMKNGTSNDQVTGGSFTVSGGKISGKIGDKGVAVVYNAKPSTSAKVSASPDSSSLTDDGISVTLNTSNTKKATYSINGKDETEFTDGTKVTIGKGANPGDKFTLSLKATANEGDDVVATYTYTKKDPNAKNTAYLKLPSEWTKAYAYVYNDDPTAAKDALVKKNAEWPGVEMTKVSDGLLLWLSITV